MIIGLFDLEELEDLQDVTRSDGLTVGGHVTARTRGRDYDFTGTSVSAGGRAVFLI